MDICDFYTELGADYGNVLRRLGNEARIRKYLNKFSADESFAELISGLSKKNYGDAFRAAHTLKGICLNLELIPLSELSIQLTELLRDYDPAADGKIDETLSKTTEVYRSIVSKIDSLVWDEKE